MIRVNGHCATVSSSLSLRTTTRSDVGDDGASAGEDGVDSED